MLEILGLNDDYPASFEKDNQGVILISNKIHWPELHYFTRAYYNEKCFFKKPGGEKIEIVQDTNEQNNICVELMELAQDCVCGTTPCKNFLEALHLLYKINFLVLHDPGLYYVIQTNKIYPGLLGCLHTEITSKLKTAVYFTTSGISNLVNNFGGIHETKQ